MKHKLKYFTLLVKRYLMYKIFYDNFNFYNVVVSTKKKIKIRFSSKKLTKVGFLFFFINWLNFSKTSFSKF